MAWWHKKVVFPVRRAWLAVSVRIRSRKDDGGILRRLHDDVQMCGYQDVQVMWEMMLRRSSEMDVLAKQRQRQRPFWRLSSSSPSSSSSFSSSCSSPTTRKASSSSL